MIIYGMKYIKIVLWLRIETTMYTKKKKKTLMYLHVPHFTPVLRAITGGRNAGRV
jgi:hypothetical protein